MSVDTCENGYLSWYETNLHLYLKHELGNQKRSNRVAVITTRRLSVPMLQETYDNRDNLEMLQFLVWHEGVGQWGD